MLKPGELIASGLVKCLMGGLIWAGVQKDRRPKRQAQWDSFLDNSKAASLFIGKPSKPFYSLRIGQLDNGP